MSRFRSDKVRAWLPEPPSAELRASVERLARLEDVRRIALMPDAHVANHVCVGAVVATAERVYPDAVGGDIGCGMLAARFDACADAVDERVALRFLEKLRSEVPTNRRPSRVELPAHLDAQRLSEPVLQRVLDRDGRVQFGTLGRGNHFLELQEAGDDGSLWVMIHSGSRALGPAIRNHHSKMLGVGNRLLGLEASSDAGKAYLRDATLAVEYAEASRRFMLERASALLENLAGVRLDEDSTISCVHNFVRLEAHGDDLLWVHRKGAASADDGETAVVPGSMGSTSFHVAGRGNPDALRSSSHGAGRCMSRTEARRRITLGQFEEEMAGVWFERRGEALVDEAPSAYKPIRDVMRAQKALTKIVRRLTPLVAYKGT